MESHHNQCQMCPACHKVPRRTLLGALVAGINGVVMAAIVGPTLGFVASPLKRKPEGGKWVDVLGESDLADGETKAINYTLKVQDGYMMADRTYSAYVQRKGGKVIAYDPTCPHLGCHVQFKPRRRRYVCPCHGGTFDEDGNHLAGPPPRGLTKIATKVENGRILLYKA